MKAARLALLVCAAYSGACGRDTTGVFLTIEGGGLTVDQLRVTAVSSRSTVAKVLPRPGAGSIVMPVSLIAELPAVSDTVVFEVEAMLGGETLLAAQSTPVAITPHALAHASVRLVLPSSVSPADAGAAPGGGSEVPPDAGMTPEGTGGGGSSNGDGGVVKPPPPPPPQPIYAMSVLADAPVVYYRLGEAAGNAIAADATTHRLTGTWGALVTHKAPSPLGAAEPILDGAAGFAGNPPLTGVVSRTVTPALQPAQTLTVELWLRHPADDANEQVVLSYDSQSQAFAAYVVSLVGETLKFTIKTDSTSVNDSVVASRAAILPNTPYHVVAIYDGSAMSLYINGVLDVRKPIAGLLVYGDATSGLGIGGSFTPLGRPSFVGVVDEVAIYDTLLSAARIAEHHRLGAGI